MAFCMRMLSRTLPSNCALMLISPAGMMNVSVLSSIATGAAPADWRLYLSEPATSFLPSFGSMVGLTSSPAAAGFWVAVTVPPLMFETAIL